MAYFDDKLVVIYDAGKPGRPGHPGVRGVPGIPGSPGNFSVRFYLLRGATTKWSKSVQSLPDRNGDFSFQLESATVDLRTGTVSVAADTEDVVQNLCLGFSVAVLYVLCQPRPVQKESGQHPADEPAKPLKEVMSPSTIQKMETEGLELVVAAGYLYDTPCNSYIKSTVFAGACSAGCGGDGGAGDAAGGGCAGVAGCGGCGGCGG